MKIILEKDQVNELPKRSIVVEKVDKIGLETGTFPTTANAVVQLAITEKSTGHDGCQRKGRQRQCSLGAETSPEEA